MKPLFVVNWTCIAILSVIASTSAQAQTLNDQYEFYLATGSDRCQNLGFARDGFANLLPGQAGPNLFAYCSGPPGVRNGGGARDSIGSSLGGGAGAALGRGRGGEEDAALRRRRDRQRKDQGDASTGADASDFDLANIGNMNLFLSLDYQHERQKSRTYESGRSSHGLEGTLGADYRFGAHGLAGLALKYQKQSGDLDGGGDFDASGKGLWTYASWLPRDGLFVDLAAGLGLKRVHTGRIVSRQLIETDPSGQPTVRFSPAPQAASSDADTHDASGELRSGYDFSFSSVTFGPRAALTLKRTSLDAFVESGSTPMTLAFDAQTATSVRSLIGIQASKAFNVSRGVMVPQINIDWVHEYRDDQRVITARFAEDLRATPAKLYFLNQAPDRDWVALRLNMVAVFARGVSVFASVESMAGHAYIDRYRGSVGIRMEM